MVGQYDMFEKSWISGAGRTANWSYNNGSGLRNCRPQFFAKSQERLPHRVAICDVTSATNTRTVLATLVPPAWRCGNTAPVLTFDSQRDAAAGLAILNSMVFDWFARRMIAGLHLNRFYLETLCWPRLESEAVDLLARAGISLQRLNPRWSRNFEVQSLDATSDDYVDLHIQIERTVAQGYGLRGEDLELVFNESPDDRRGLWRYFSSDPHALEIARGIRGEVGDRANDENGLVPRARSAILV